MPNTAENRNQEGKGTAPPHWMPSIMGWMSLEYMKERARMLAEIHRVQE